MPGVQSTPTRRQPNFQEYPVALNREAILNASDLQTETVPVPEWGGDIIIRTLSASARDLADQVLKGADEEGNGVQAARFIAACAVDEQGQPLFTDADIPALAAKANHVITRVFRACLRVN